MELSTPVEKLYMVGGTLARRLKKLGIETVEDFLYHFPFRYADYSLVSKISQLQPGEIVTIQGQVLEMKNVYTKYGKKIQKAKVADETGTIEVVWYNQPFLVKVINPGAKINLSGKVDWFGKKLVMEVPEYEILKSDEAPLTKEALHTGRLVPVYPETAGISSKWLRSRIAPILEECKDKLLEYLPYSIIREFNLLNLRQSLCQIHFPQNKEMIKKARERLAFEELFLIQLGALKRRWEWEKQILGNKFQISPFKSRIQNFIQSLPFELTQAQRKAVGEILTDLAKAKPMNRLLEGDVGSGKTVVATITMYVAYLNGFQSAFMAPTEILAFQHYDTVSRLLTPLGLKVALVTGSKKLGKQKTNFQFDIIIGTHALLSQKLKFQKAGLVVIDEQQRFGVEQRALLRQKGANPHLLTMTATPIPRTVALTLYGDLDLSFLDEMPKGRLPVKTWVVPPLKRTNAYQWIRTQIQQNSSQAFIICPLIEESETLATVRAATQEFNRLSKEVFLDLKLGLLHGRLKANEKETVLEEFRSGKTDILVATPVVEVGIDIPGATIMMIEGAERFGLAQIHQLRGRVGRGNRQSFCLLFTDSESDIAVRRLKALETCHVGAKLAELDLKIRGPGEIYGVRQHGFSNLKIASLADFALIEQTKRAAQNLFAQDPNLLKYSLLHKKLEKFTIKQVAPD